MLGGQGFCRVVASNFRSSPIPLGYVAYRLIWSVTARTIDLLAVAIGALCRGFIDRGDEYFEMSDGLRGPGPLKPRARAEWTFEAMGVGTLDL